MFKKILCWYCCFFLLPLTNVVLAAPGQTTVAHWKDNKKGAFSLMFDDANETQAQVGMPGLVARNLIGTWFVNPGTDRWQTYITMWETVGPNSGQEYGNHTWTHNGVTNFAVADSELGLCAQKIWSLRPAGATKLTAFTQPGGVSWNISGSENSTLLNKYNCVPIDLDASFRTDNGWTAPTMIALVQECMNDQWKKAHCHGIDGNALPIKGEDFFALLDYMASSKDTLWYDGYIAIYQYVQERNSANVAVLENTNSLIRLNLTSSMDTALYKAPLTLISEVPAAWDLCLVTQNTQSKIYPIDAARKVQYQIVPGRGEFRLANISSLPIIWTEPVAQSVEERATVTFKVMAVGSAPLSYQWQRNTVDIQGAQSATYTMPSVVLGDNNTSYRCIVSNQLGSDTSASVKLLVRARIAPVISVQPRNVMVTETEPATFSLTYRGSSPLTYQWQRNSTDILGANSKSYTLPAAQLSDSGAQFRCKISNDLGNVTSNYCTLSVKKMTLQSGLTWEAEAGVIDSPFYINTTYIVQDINNEKRPTAGGKAVYFFNIAQAGNYIVNMLLNAPDDATNSIYLNIDAEPSDPDMIFDIFTFTNGFEQRTASWRGGGTDVSNEFVPIEFPLTVGIHKMIIRGREIGTQIDKITMVYNSPYGIKDQAVKPPAYPFYYISGPQAITFYCGINQVSSQQQVPANLTIYDLKGNTVKTLVSGLHQPGSYRAVWNTENQANGVYFYTWNVDGKKMTGKLNIIK
jgi:hypothetical protein